VDTNRGFSTNILPNYTLVNVEKPPCFVRKFSPDGSKIIAFSADQTSLEVYSYEGPAAIADLLQTVEGEYLSNEENPTNNRIRNCAFNRFFKPKFTVAVSPITEQLNRECSLFSDDGRYVIIGSASPIPEEPHPALYSIYQNNESVSPNPRNQLENYTIYVVDIEKGMLVDKTMFKTDKIVLSHNQGIYLYRNVLAILSIQHQTIHIFHLESDGTLVKDREIGRFCYDDDDMVLSSSGVLTGESQCSLPTRPAVYRPFKETSINSLKHRILVFLHQRAVALSEQEGNPFELRNFYKYFEQIRWLRIWKMQLLDEDHLFIKYASEDVVTLRSYEPNSQQSFFVVYNMKTTKVLAVYENTSEKLLDIFENFCDYFRLSCGTGSSYTSSPSNNVYANLTQQRFKQTIISAKNGGPSQARKRVLAQLPISAQSYSPSPLLDLSLFSYDEKWVSVMERPKACGEYPIRFYGRECGLLKFKIYPGVQDKNPPPQARRLVAFTFHPSDPFAISVQKTNLEYVVNFHVRHAL
jgi:de-etiolated-1